MNSETLPSFWEAYQRLDETIKKRARKAYFLWRENPFHPSLQFKCINHAENIWSARITLAYRAIGFIEGDRGFGLVNTMSMSVSFQEIKYKVQIVGETRPLLPPNQVFKGKGLGCVAAVFVLELRPN